jgi:acyl carrier protein
MNNIEEKVLNVVAEKLKIDKPLTSLQSSPVGDISADTFDIQELIMALEDEFGVRISEESAEGIISTSMNRGTKQSITIQDIITELKLIFDI